MSVTVTIPAACVAGKRWPGMFGDLTPAVPRFQYGHGGDLLVIFDADIDEPTAAAVEARLLEPHETAVLYVEQRDALIESALAYQPADPPDPGQQAAQIEELTALVTLLANPPA